HLYLKGHTRGEKDSDVTLGARCLGLMELSRPDRKGILLVLTVHEVDSSRMDRETAIIVRCGQKPLYRRAFIRVARLALLGMGSRKPLLFSRKGLDLLFRALLLLRHGRRASHRRRPVGGCRYVRPVPIARIRLLPTDVRRRAGLDLRACGARPGRG